MKNYYTLLIRMDEPGQPSRWEIAFSDYNREVVKEELAEFTSAGIFRKDAMIIKTGDSQKEITERVAFINQVERN